MSEGGQGRHEYTVKAQHERFAGSMFTVVTDEVVMPGGKVAARDYMKHVGAVGVVAVDERDRVVLIRQYRHPLRAYLWELPAGLIDVKGEDLPAAALRELAEEADLTAGRLDALVDLNPSPGASNELIREYLARDLGEVPEAERHRRTNEEAELVVVRVPLDEAVAMALRGDITNAACVAGVLAAAHARARNYADLRPVDAPLPDTASGR